MKNALIILLSFLLLTPAAFAQKAKKEYTNFKGEKVKKSEAQLYRMVSQNSDNTWHAEYYRYPNGKLIKTAEYKTKAIETKHGLQRYIGNNALPKEEQEYVNGVMHGAYRKYDRFGTKTIEGQYQQGSKDGEWTTFRSNGKRESITVYYKGKHVARTKAWGQESNLLFEGETKDGTKDGAWTYYFSDGKKKRLMHFQEGKRNGLNQKWFKNGQLKLEQAYQNDLLHGGYKKWNETGILLEEGSFVKGQKNGIWILNETDGTLAKKWDYNEVPAKVVFISEKRKQQEEEEEQIVMEDMDADENDEMVFMIVEKDAQPTGGMMAFRKYISTYLSQNYPDEARKAGIQGTVYIQFTVEKNGGIYKCEVLKGIGGGCDEAAVKAIKSFGKWKPAEQRGKLVRQSFNFPFRFKL